MVAAGPTGKLEVRPPVRLELVIASVVVASNGGDGDGDGDGQEPEWRVGVAPVAGAANHF